MPYESPKHCPSTTEVVSNPWNAAPGNASSLKWHSTGTADYIYTRGNNVWAQEDANGNNGTGIAATSTSPADPLSFDFMPDFNVAPGQTTTTPNQQFNTTNLFYWNNIMHDVMYRYGFDEVSGNFQSNNQGRGGAGNDYVLADAQDGSGTNNANFSTPADGGSGRMQMYLWSPVPTLTVNSPSTIAGQYQAVESNFSTANKLINLGQRTGQVVYYNDNATATTTHEACAGVPVNSVLGKIALIDRGNCNFTIKVKNAQTAGAIAVIMVNNVQGSPIIMGGTDNTITIPAIMISINDGYTIKNELANNVNVTMAVGQYLDGDVDNGVIAHEFSHGTSNRLTGGPSQASCLANAEQMGEGWSDYYGLMVTQDWANSNLNTGSLSPRGIGTYVVGQLPSQSGIRSQKYCTDFDINNKVYAATVPTETHDLGEIWCATLWDMTWNIIQDVGAINPSIYDTAATGGNSIAMKLVTEGMKLQPCSPGFIDGRNAILKADSLLYGGAHACAIWEAFRRRGMGINASQGSSASVTDQIADYTPLINLSKSQNIDSASEGQSITYTSVVSSCSPLSNYVIRDTLPANVTYVSGGTYDATNRVVSFSVDFTTGQTQSFSFVVSVNTGSYFASQTLLDEQVTGSTIPASFTTSSTTTNNWSVSSAQSVSAPNALFTPNAVVASDQKLETTNALSMGTGTSAITFSHWYNTQAANDGGIIEVSTDNGTTWTDLSNKITAGYYNATLGTGTGNPIAGRKAWSGNSTRFIKSSVNLSSYAGQNIKLRFRFGSNNTTAGTGWYVDDILVKRAPVVNMRTSLFDQSGVRVNYSDTVTRIIETVTCTSVSLAAQPNDITACVGSNAIFNANAGGSNPSYQWQMSTDGGVTFSNITGANASSLSLSNVTASMNNNKYRVIITNNCPSSVTSSAATLTTQLPAAIQTQPDNITICSGGNASFNVSATGSANTYQWQVSTDGGVTFSNISGATSSSYSINNVTSSANGNQYRVVISSCNPNALNSSAAILTVSNQASISAQPLSTPACTGGSATFSVTATGSSLVYQWQISTDGGITYNNIAGATSSTLNLNAVTSAMNNNRYRVVISNNCASSATSDAGILIVSDPASLTAQPNDNNVCEGQSASFSVTATGSNISYQWQVSSDGGTTYTNIPGANGNTYTISNATPTQNNNRYRAILFSCSATGLNSNAAILTVNGLASVTTAPANVSACVGNNAVFTVNAGGSNLNYQWQISTDGGTSYTNITGANSTSYTASNVSLAMNNYRYRVIVNNNCPSTATSTEGILTVTGNAVINTQPQATTICEGNNATFSANAAGSAYQWQVSTNGGATYADISGAIAATLTLTNVTTSMGGNKYRLVVTGCAGSTLLSNEVLLTVNSNAIINTQPSGVTSCIGNSAVFTTSASGTNINYQWQVSTDGGTTFTDITGANSSSYSISSVSLMMNNNQYRVLVSNSCTSNLNSNTATLIVTDQASIINQPTAASACPGATASFTVQASGPGLSYQWQVSTDGGTTFNNISGATNNSYQTSAVTTGMNNYRYRVLVYSNCSAQATPSSDGLLTILPEAQIQTAPTNVNGCDGSSVSFNASISGNNVSYQWQVSTDGGISFTNISGANSNTLSLSNISTSMNNNRYRVVAIANPCGVTTTSATLFVLPSPVVTLSANPGTALFPGLLTTLTATAIPASSNYTWYKNGVVLPGVTGQTLIVRFNEAGSYKAKSLNGCDNISNVLNITDSLSSQLFIYPNPNDGLFTVQYYSGNAPTKRLLNLFDAKGARIFTKTYTITGYEKMEVDIRPFAAGSYMLMIYDEKGNKISSGKVIKR